MTKTFIETPRWSFSFSSMKMKISQLLELADFEINLKKTSNELAKCFSPYDCCLSMCVSVCVFHEAKTLFVQTE